MGRSAGPDDLVEQRHDPLLIARRRMMLMMLKFSTAALLVGACFVIRYLAQLIDPSTRNMPQLQMPMQVLATEGALAAIVVFVLFALFVPRPIFWCSYERIWTICPSSSIIAPRLRSLVEITDCLRQVLSTEYWVLS